MTLLSARILRAAALESVRKLDPRHTVRNPVMFVVEIGAFLTTVVALLGTGSDPRWYTVTVAVWLWLTVLFLSLIHI